MLLYYHGFRFFNMGYASAMAMLLLAVAFAVTLRDRAQLAALGALLGGGAMSARRVRPFERRKLPARRSAGSASSSPWRSTAC